MWYPEPIYPKKYVRQMKFIGSETDPTLKLCQWHDVVGIHTAQDLSRKVLGEAHRWSMEPSRDDSDWIHMIYRPNSRTTFHFWGHGFWYEALQGAWFVEREKLQALGVKCL